MGTPANSSARETYRTLARLYDRVYAGKDYAEEARRIRRLARANGRSGGRRLLDVACGTGRHLAELRRWYDVEGLDQSPEMLQAARTRLGNLPLHQGSMSEIPDLGRFDVITCLFSALGYLPDLPALQRTARSIAAHLEPGGVAIVEPWLTPQSFRAGRASGRVERDPQGFLGILSSGRRRGRTSIIDSVYVEADARGVRTTPVVHTMTLFTRAEMLGAFRRAGLLAQWQGSALPLGRGAIVARRLIEPT